MVKLFIATFDRGTRKNTRHTSNKNINYRIVAPVSVEVHLFIAITSALNTYQQELAAAESGVGCEAGAVAVAVAVAGAGAETEALILPVPEL